MTRLVLAVFAILIAASAQAVPLRLDYSVQEISTGLYEYDFDLVVDDSDGDYLSGTSFGWIVVGAHSMMEPSLFSEAAGFLTDVPDGTSVRNSAGTFSGPTICAEAGCLQPFWNTDNPGDKLEFKGVSSRLALDGELQWAFLIANPIAVGQSTLQTATPGQMTFLTANQLNLAPVPLPMPVVLLGGALLALAGLRRKAKS